MQKGSLIKHSTTLQSNEFDAKLSQGSHLHKDLSLYFRIIAGNRFAREKTMEGSKIGALTSMLQKKKISYKYALTSLLEMPANMFSSCCSLKPAHSKLHVLKCVRRLLVR